MSIKTEDSLNCPCNGIFKCGLHNPPKYFINPYAKEDMEKFMKIYLEKPIIWPHNEKLFLKWNGMYQQVMENESGTPSHFITPKKKSNNQS